MGAIPNSDYHTFLCLLFFSIYEYENLMPYFHQIYFLLELLPSVYLFYPTVKPKNFTEGQ